MDIAQLRAQVAHGEDSVRQFKVDLRNAESLASEMAAFANAEDREERVRLLQNMNMAGDDERLNLAGVLLFADIRNPILVSYAAKGLLPYHGLGSGIKRALGSWPDITFTDDREGDLFTVTIMRKRLEELQGRSPGP